MKVTLVHPPQATLFSPYLAGPSLAAALVQAGHEVQQVDLNLEANLTMLGRDYLDSLAGGVGKGLADPVHRALMALRQRESYQSLDEVRACYGVLDQAFAAIGKAFAPTEISHDLKMRFNPFSLADLNEAIGSEAENPYIELFGRTIVPRLVCEPPDLVGIGLAFDSQVIPALTLARLLKQALPELPICLGGNIVTKMHRKLLERQIWLPGVDFAVIHEGETALVSLLDALSSSSAGFDEVPNLLRRVGDRVVASDASHFEDLGTLSTPLFDGLPLDDYLLPIRLLPILTSRGCYWSRCAFCTHAHGYGHFRQRPAERLLDDLDTLDRRYGCSTVFLADEAVPKRQIELMAQYARTTGKPLQWFGDVRFEAYMARPEGARELVESGCRLLAFGLESASPRVLELMDKGGAPELYQAVLRSCHEAGIVTVVMFFSGFPGETMPEAHTTFQFIQRNRDIIDGWGNGAFSLQGGSAVFLNPERFGITSIRERAGAELSEVYDYTVARGLSMSAAAQISESIAGARLRDPKYAGLLPREISFTQKVVTG